MTEKAKKQEGWISFTLPESGRAAKRMAKPKGTHLREAAAIANGDQSVTAFGISHATCIVESAPGVGDFQKLTLEEIYELDMADAAALNRESCRPLNEEASPAPTTSDSTSSPPNTSPSSESTG